METATFLPWEGKVCFFFFGLFFEIWKLGHPENHCLVEIKLAVSIKCCALIQRVSFLWFIILYRLFSKLTLNSVLVIQLPHTSSSWFPSATSYAWAEQYHLAGCCILAQFHDRVCCICTWLSISVTRPFYFPFSVVLCSVYCVILGGLTLLLYLIHKCCCVALLKSSPEEQL